MIAERISFETVQKLVSAYEEFDLAWSQFHHVEKIIECDPSAKAVIQYGEKDVPLLNMPMDIILDHCAARLQDAVDQIHDLGGEIPLK